VSPRRIARSLVFALCAGLASGACRREAPPESRLPAPLVYGPAVKTRLAELRARVTDAPLPAAKSADELVAHLADADPAARRSTEDELVAVGPAAIPALAAALADAALPDHARGTAALALGRLDHDAALPPLLAALRDRSRYVRAFAAMACETLGRDEAVPELLFRFKEEYETEGVVVNAAARALLRFGNVGGLDRLVKNLRARQLEREGAIALLAEIAGTDRGFDPSGAENERRAAAAAWEEWLAFEGAAFLAARPAPPEPSDRLALRIAETVDRLREYQMRTIDDARLVLERLGRAAVPFLRLGLADEEANIRGYALEVVTLLGARAREATPEIAALTRDDLLAPFAYQALGVAGEKDVAIPLLVAGLIDARVEVRIACAGGLGAQGDAARGLAPLQALLAEKNLPADLEFAAAVAAGTLGDFARFRRAIDLAEKGGAIDSGVALRAVEDALSRASRRTATPFRPAGANRELVAPPRSGSSHARPETEAGAGAGAGAALSEENAEPSDRAARAAALRAYLDAHARGL
jgi:HEAT repeat protein